MRVNKPLVYANITALTLNGILLCLMAMKLFPPLLGIVLLLAFLLGSVWLSCYANGRLPKRVRKVGFYSAVTEYMEHA